MTTRFRAGDDVEVKRSHKYILLGRYRLLYKQAPNKHAWQARHYRTSREMMLYDDEFEPAPVKVTGRVKSAKPLRCRHPRDHRHATYVPTEGTPKGWMLERCGACGSCRTRPPTAAVWSRWERPELVAGVAKAGGK